MKDSTGNLFKENYKASVTLNFFWEEISFKS